MLSEPVSPPDQPRRARPRAGGTAAGTASPGVLGARAVRRQSPLSPLRCCAEAASGPPPPDPAAPQVLPGRDETRFGPKATLCRGPSGACVTREPGCAATRGRPHSQETPRSRRSLPPCCAAPQAGPEPGCVKRAAVCGNVKEMTWASLLWCWGPVANHVAPRFALSRVAYPPSSPVPAPTGKARNSLSF